MACGLPVIVTDLPSNREWVQPGVNGWLVPPGDPEALGSTILEVLANEAGAKAVREANVSTIRQKADWQQNSDLLLAAYERLARGNGR
jgi:glycosyltransferase involved in cell wall biosynthesis